ncbi:MAG TPA: biotin--[acetyl-CoA-carboxylase] ligase [Xanthobacteraceae bacterium]|jgi:BirA family biotin operon repressor/biotin-[acetyl-CoA-carboxylase] ligase|nr:biotin--[acetyl-CoA-carboxylase] ligase [Xanthobacteraceae bacterium]
MVLDSSAASGARLLCLDEVGSTNAEAFARARAGERGPLWITARGQTAGRGRRGRAWVSEPGNLYASLLLTDPAPPQRAAELSLVAALAVHDAIAERAAVLGPRLTLKWPNDVLCDGAKLAGILVEGEGVAGGTLAVVIGIGVNCAHHPADTTYPATDLAAAGVLATPESLVQSLVDAMARRLGEWDRGENFAAIRAGWLKRAAGLGAPARVRLPERELDGIAETLDEAGRLVLRLADGSRERIAAGEMFPASARA